ncbi:MAG: helix-hairpin-helix domain-containing protein [Gallionellaceae bacterium]|nr:helix-hairpin-helix domain-containing protein [Gallionellaceae bacterium]
MNPSKVDRNRLARLEDLPNIGKAMAGDLRQIGIRVPADLVGQDPLDLYAALGEATGTRQDPCVLDVFMSVTRFMAGDPARPWWTFTEERKQLLKQGSDA